MKSICKVSILGHIAADPELKQSKDGHPFVTFPVATNRYVKDADGGRREIADFHRVVGWNGIAKLATRYLSKGMAIYLDGRLANSSFEDKEGNRHYRTEILADNLSIVTWKKSNKGEELDIEEISKEAV